MLYSTKNSNSSKHFNQDRKKHQNKIKKPEITLPRKSFTISVGTGTKKILLCRNEDNPINLNKNSLLTSLRQVGMLQGTSSVYVETMIMSKDSKLRESAYGI
jgi:hypothetical protein